MFFLGGQFVIHKMILENSLDNEDEEESAGAAVRMNADPAQELREQKKRRVLGNWLLP